MANLKNLTDAIDAQVIKGDIIAAFDQYAADDCCTLSNEADKTHSKAEKLAALNWFFSNVASVNRIERVAVKLLNDEVADSQFVFDFTDKHGNPMVFNEIIRRTWNNGLLVEEIYLANQVIESAPEAAPAKKTATKATKDSEVAPVPKKAPAAKKSAAKGDDLTIVEGIGPKIAELLIAAGITNFAELAASTPETVKSILEAAGKRYQMHDPATWPEQAALARDGKTEELNALQAELKGGK